MPGNESELYEVVSDGPRRPQRLLGISPQDALLEYYEGPRFREEVDEDDLADQIQEVEVLVALKPKPPRKRTTIFEGTLTIPPMLEKKEDPASEPRTEPSDQAGESEGGDEGSEQAAGMRLQKVLHSRRRRGWVPSHEPPGEERRLGLPVVPEPRTKAELIHRRYAEQPIVFIPCSREPFPQDFVHRRRDMARFRVHKLRLPRYWLKESE